MSLHLIVGPMFSGKSTELLREMRRAEIAEKKVILIKHSIDDRYSEDTVIDHSRQVRRKADISVGRLLNVPVKLVEDADVIGIDEGQFFEDIRLAGCWADSGKTVYVSALDGDFNRAPFMNITSLIPNAEHIKKLKAICYYCKEANACYSHRVAGVGDDRILIGSDPYKASCRKCYIRMKKDE